MKQGGDHSPAFVKAQVLATNANCRNKAKLKRNPWRRGQKTKNDLAKKLAEVEKHYDFYQTLYRQYVGDLLLLAIYVRKILNQKKLREYLEAHYPADIELFESVLAENEVKTIS